jgi:hypothetical protein
MGWVRLRQKEREKKDLLGRDQPNSSWVELELVSGASLAHIFNNI